MNYDHQFLEEAHVHCTRQRNALESSEWAACFFCERFFQPNEVEEWTDNDSTAICPYCGIDSVLADASGLPILDRLFLRAMHRHCFEWL